VGILAMSIFFKSHQEDSTENDNKTVIGRKTILDPL
jgi:hypothetical protein